MNPMPTPRPSRWRTAVLQRWQLLGQREQRLVTVAALVVTGALIVGVGEQLLDERQRVASRLPAARAELARLQAVADEIAVLRQELPPTEQPTDSVQSGPDLDRARRHAELHGIGLTLSLDADDAIALGGEAEAEATLAWLAALQAEHGLFVRTLSIRTRAGPDTVSGTLVMRTLR